MKLSLLHKGLLLVSIPLCFEVGIFAMLLHLQNELEGEASRLNRSRLIGDIVARVTSRILVLEESFNHFQGPGPAVQTVHQMIGQMNADFAALRRLAASNPAMLQDVENCGKEMEAANQDFEELRRLMASGELENFKKASRAFRMRFNDHLRQIMSFGLWQMASRSAQEIDTDRSSAIRRQAVILLKCALAASCFIGFLSAGIYSKYLIRRLQRLSFNATRLGQRQELLPKIQGQDEIARVDKALHDAANEINKLQMLREEIIGMVSHDIRSPLTTIKCIGDALANDLKDHLDEDSRQQLKSIDDNCDRILSISKDLLDIQRLDSGTMVIEKSRADVRDSVQAAINATEGLRQNRAITVEARLEPAPANIDPIKIEQVVTNLLSNAIKFSPRNGVVGVDLKMEDGWIYFSVTDQGKGIPAHLRKDIFNRFQQVDADDSRLRGGTGLGLAIAKALIEMHDGKIGAESLSPRGSRFYFTLRAAPK